MSDLIAYSGSQILAAGTLIGNQLNWAPVNPADTAWWKKCDGLELRGLIVPSVWLVVEKISVTLDQNGFPQNFYIVTPFFVYWCTLSMTRNAGAVVWHLYGAVLGRHQTFSSIYQ